MSEKIKVDFIWNEDSAIKSFDELYKYEFNHSVKRYIGWLFIGFLQFGVVAILKKGDASLLLFSTVVLFYWYFLKKYISKKLFLKNFKSDPLKDKEIILEADKEGLHFKISNDFWKWDEIEEIKNIKNGLLLIKSPNHFFIPNFAFKEIEDKSNFIKLKKLQKNSNQKG